MKPQPRIPRYMAYPARQRTPRPDSALMDAAVVGWGVFLLLLCFWAAGAKLG